MNSGDPKYSLLEQNSILALEIALSWSELVMQNFKMELELIGWRCSKQVLFSIF